MKPIFSPDWTSSLFHPSFWLMGMGFLIPAMHLMLETQVGTDGFLTLSLMFWCTIGYFLWEKKDQLPGSSDPSATLVGGFLLGISSLAAATPLRYPSQLTPLYLFPFVAGFGWFLLASGWSGLRTYRRELLLLFYLGFPIAFLESIPVNMTELTAKFATFGLWYGGFDVSRIADVIRLPTGSIFVFPDCSGIASMSYLCSLAVLMGTLLSLRLPWRFLLAGCGLVLGFMINGVRVMLLAILVAGSYTPQFHFWHDGSGSLIFSAIGAILLSGLAYWFVRLSETNDIELTH